MKVTLKNYHDEKMPPLSKKKMKEKFRDGETDTQKKLLLHSATTENRVTLPRRQIIHRADLSKIYAEFSLCIQRKTILYILNI